MKNIQHFLIFVILLFQHTTSNADVLEIGGGLTESYNGEFPLWSDSSVKMKSLGMPITISLMFNNLRIGYIDYKQYARDFHSTVSTYAKVENNILSFNYSCTYSFISLFFSLLYIKIPNWNICY